MKRMIKYAILIVVMLLIKSNVLAAPLEISINPRCWKCPSYVFYNIISIPGEESYNYVWGTGATNYEVDKGRATYLGTNCQVSNDYFSGSARDCLAASSIYYDGIPLKLQLKYACYEDNSGKRHWDIDQSNIAWERKVIYTNAKKIEGITSALDCYDSKRAYTHQTCYEIRFASGDKKGPFYTSADFDEFAQIYKEKYNVSAGRKDNWNINELKSQDECKASDIKGVDYACYQCNFGSGNVNLWDFNTKLIKNSTCRKLSGVNNANECLKRETAQDLKCWKCYNDSDPSYKELTIHDRPYDLLYSKNNPNSPGKYENCYETQSRVCDEPATCWRCTGGGGGWKYVLYKGKPPFPDGKKKCEPTESLVNCSNNSDSNKCYECPWGFLWQITNPDASQCKELDVKISECNGSVKENAKCYKCTKTQYFSGGKAITEHQLPSKNVPIDLGTCEELNLQENEICEDKIIVKDESNNITREEKTTCYKCKSDGGGTYLTRVNNLLTPEDFDSENCSPFTPSDGVCYGVFEDNNKNQYGSDGASYDGLQIMIPTLDFGSGDVPCNELLGETLTDLVRSLILIARGVGIGICVLNGMLLFIPAVVSKDKSKLNESLGKVVKLLIILVLLLLLPQLVKIVAWIGGFNDLSCIFG